MINRQVLDLWNRYKPTIAVDAIEYDRELRQLLGTNLAEVGTDCISRQQAIYAISEALATGKQPIKALEQLPPIQPEIVRCEECKYHYQRNCPIEKYFSLNGFCSRGKRREVTE